MSVMIPLLLLAKRRARKRKYMQSQSMLFVSGENIPFDVIRPLFPTLKAFAHFINSTNHYAEEVNRYSATLICDLTPGLKHHSIHCVSMVESFESLTGFNIEEFAKLMESLQPDLKEKFPRSPNTLGANEKHPYMSRRMKLFLFLYRLKQGATFHCMEPLFGWSTSVLQETFCVILEIIVRRMFKFHHGFLAYKGIQWQHSQMRIWTAKHCLKGDYDDFIERIKLINRDAEKNHIPPRVEETRFLGSLYAIDGTFSVRPRVTDSIVRQNDGDTASDPLYSNYIKMHAYKLMPVVSHHFEEDPKYILWIAIGPGSVSDNALGQQAIHEMHGSGLHPQATGLGDHAFHGLEGVIPPYTKLNMSTNAARNMPTFNVSHSGDRMCSEHGIRLLKLWGAIRGRTDCRLFENESLFTASVLAAWALTNYKACGCVPF